MGYITYAVSDFPSYKAPWWIVGDGGPNFWGSFWARWPRRLDQCGVLHTSGGWRQTFSGHGFWLVLWNMTFIYFYDFPFTWEWNIIPTDFHSLVLHIFQRGSSTTNQDFIFVDTTSGGPAIDLTNLPETVRYVHRDNTGFPGVDWGILLRFQCVVQIWVPKLNSWCGWWYSSKYHGYNTIQL